MKNHDSKTISKKLRFVIEFEASAEAAKKDVPGNGKVEIIVNDKTRYRIDYDLINNKDFDFLRAFAERAFEDEIPTIMKLIVGVIAHRAMMGSCISGEDGEVLIQSIQHEYHVPKIIDPHFEDTPRLQKSPFSSLLPKLVAAAPKMKQFTDLMMELYALNTYVDFSEFKSVYDLLLPRVKQAKKRATAIAQQKEKDWHKKIYDEFPEYLLYAPDLILRLAGKRDLVPERIREAVEATGAEIFRPSLIALELIARVSGAVPYQYS